MKVLFLNISLQYDTFLKKKNIDKLRYNNLILFLYLSDNHLHGSTNLNWRDVVQTIQFSPR